MKCYEKYAEGMKEVEAEEPPAVVADLFGSDSDDSLAGKEDLVELIGEKDTRDIGDALKAFRAELEEGLLEIKPKKKGRGKGKKKKVAKLKGDFSDEASDKISPEVAEVIVDGMSDEEVAEMVANMSE